MKKFASALVSLIVIVCALSGCSTQSVDLNEVMDKLNSDFSLSLTQLSEVEDLNSYYSIDAEDVKQFAAEIDSNNNAPVEIVLVEAVDADAAADIEQAFTNRYNSIYSQYSSYSADQLDVVKNSQVTKDGNFVSMIVADKAPDMREVYYTFIDGTN